MIKFKGNKNIFQPRTILRYTYGKADVFFQ